MTVWTLRDMTQGAHFQHYVAGALSADVGGDNADAAEYSPWSSVTMLCCKCGE
jgi:hypothetical protein